MLPVWWETSGPMYWLDPFGGPIMVGGSWYCRRKFRSQTSDNMDRWKSRGVKSQRRERAEERRSEKRKSEKKEDAGARKGSKVAKHCFFQWFVAPEGRSVGSLKRRVRSHVARWEMKSCTPWWREAHFQVKMFKAHQCRSTFGSWDAHRCGAKHISKSKLLKTEGFGALLDVQMSFRVAGAKDCAPCQKWAKTWRLCSISKNDGKRGT